MKINNRMLITYKSLRYIITNYHLKSKYEQILVICYNTLILLYYKSSTSVIDFLKAYLDTYVCTSSFIFKINKSSYLLNYP